MNQTYKKIILLLTILFAVWLYLPIMTTTAVQSDNSYQLAVVNTSDALLNLDKTSERAGLKKENNQSLGTRLGQLAYLALTLSGLIMLGLFVWGGFLWMTAQGNEERISQAKKLFAGGAAGMLVALLSFSFVIMLNRGTGGIAPDVNVSYEPLPGEDLGTCMVCERVLWSIECNCSITPESGCTTVGDNGTTWSILGTYPEYPNDECLGACAEQIDLGNRCFY